MANGFARNRLAVGVVQVALLILLALVLMLRIASTLRRLWRRRSRLHRFVVRHGLSKTDLAFVLRLARAAGVAPIDLFTRIDLFERKTARALAVHPSGLAQTEAAERIHHLRLLLGFDRLPAHTPLLTTRELAQGIGVDLGPEHGHLVEVTESHLSLVLRADTSTVNVGDELVLNLVHAREARYELRCRVLEHHVTPNGRILVLAHDESPRRIQLRDYARVAARGTITLHPVPPWPSQLEVPEQVAAQFEDVSGGGALVRSPVLLPVGLLTQARFALDTEVFEELPAVVLSSEERPDGAWQTRLEWGALRDGERSRLVAAVARCEVLNSQE